MDLVDHAHPMKFLIRDCDTKVTDSSDAVFVADGVRVIRTPVRAPRANAICERVIGTLRRECLDRMLILGRRHLDAVLDRTPAPFGDIDPAKVRRGDRLGDLIHEDWMVP